MLPSLKLLNAMFFVDKLIKKIEEDNCRLLSKFKERIEKVGLELPTVEVRYRNLSVEVEYEVVHGKPLPSLWNTLKTAFGANIMKEISRREKEAGIVPEPDIDTYMKATSVEGLKRTLQTDYILKILGLDICADTMVGDAMRRGISGGQKKRLTTAAILKIPSSLLDAFLWTALTYYVIGFSPEPERFFYHFFLLFLVHQASVSMFRLIASIVRNPSIASTFALFIILITFLFGGFVIRQPSLPSWLRWGFWLSPLAYAEIGVSLNEFLAPRWQKVSSSNITLGQQILESRGLYFNEYFYWIPLGALIGFWIIFNIGFTCALSYSKAPRRSRTIISQERLSNILKRKQDLIDFPRAETPKPAAEIEKIKMILPCEPITISFQNVQYFVDTPKFAGIANCSSVMPFVATERTIVYRERSILAALFLGSSEDYPRYAIYVDTMDSINLGLFWLPFPWAPKETTSHCGGGLVF
ncbi:hypothetical protein D5086_005240 [Populus alba]|uniref:Uncharacterized protein n=1 Tax=Populus alba TaxID=43335 RepID=A0ACC4CSN9_POPAL